mmetsp:Transcript_40931/g.118238  ORF Transcript_40931/g.118238 Transcript_40931/m.118238 type:complete len:215 (-) Transcript_40931:1853-2497(-)
MSAHVWFLALIVISAVTLPVSRRPNGTRTPGGQASESRSFLPQRVRLQDAWMVFACGGMQKDLAGRRSSRSLTAGWKPAGSACKPGAVGAWLSSWLAFSVTSGHHPSHPLRLSLQQMWGRGPKDQQLRHQKLSVLLIKPRTQQLPQPTLRGSPSRHASSTSPTAWPGLGMMARVANAHIGPSWAQTYVTSTCGNLFQQEALCMATCMGPSPSQS